MCATRLFENNTKYISLKLGVQCIVQHAKVSNNHV